MGCLKILHSEQKSALSKNWKIFVGGVEKTASSEKNRVNYYPFGMLQPGRSFSSNSYRYGFNGQEKDDEISGIGNSYTAKYWQYDSRLLRRWNTDPITYPWQSTYAVNNNNPLTFIDPMGLYATKKEAKKARRKARRKFGKDRVSEIYNRGNGELSGDKNEPADWGFSVTNNEDEYQGESCSNDCGSEAIISHVSTTGIFNSDDFVNFLVGQTGSFTFELSSSHSALPYVYESTTSTIYSGKSNVSNWISGTAKMWLDAGATEQNIASFVGTGFDLSMGKDLVTGITSKSFKINPIGVLLLVEANRLKLSGTTKVELGNELNGLIYDFYQNRTSYIKVVRTETSYSAPAPVASGSSVHLKYEIYDINNKLLTTINANY